MPRFLQQVILRLFHLVKITQDDLDSGTSGNSVSCPIALAVSRVDPSSYPVVGPYEIFIYGKRRFLSPQGRYFVTEYDGHRSCEPQWIKLY